MDKRHFLTAGIVALGATTALAQGARQGVDELGRGPGPEPVKKIPVRKARTTPLFLTPAGWPNGIAVDPARGVFILIILVLAIGGSLALYAWRAPMLRPGGLFAPVSREGAMVLNNLLLATAAATVFLGTLYPLLDRKSTRLNSSH